MFRKIKQFALQQSYNLARKKGVNCPDCSSKLHLPPRMPEGGLDGIVSCKSCHWEGSLLDIITRDRDPESLVVTEQPTGSKVTTGMTAEGQTWTIPAKKRPNFFWFFSLFWLAIIGFMTFAILLSDGVKNSSGEPASPWMMLFLLPFWLVGLGMLYVAIRTTFGSHTIIKNHGKITVRRHLLGSKTDKYLALDNIARIGLDTAYTQNDTPVHQVKIFAKEGKDLKFGTTLTAHEQAWIIHELREVAGLETKKRGAKNHLTGEAINSSELNEIDHKGITLKRSGGGNFTFSIQDKLAKWFLVGAIFIFIVGSIFALSSAPAITANDPSISIFNFLGKGFHLLAIVIGAITTIIGIIAFTIAIKLWGSVKNFHFKENGLEHTVIKGGSIKKSKTSAKSQFTGAKVSASGHVNNDPRYKVKLVGQKHLTLCHFVKEEIAYELEDWVNHWLQSGNDEPDTAPSDSTAPDYGYGAPMKL